MKHTKEEILNALKIIKEECGSSKECIKCAFYDENQNSQIVCMFDRPVAPACWNLNNPEPETWRAFK